MEEELQWVLWKWLVDAIVARAGNGLEANLDTGKG